MKSCSVEDTKKLKKIIDKLSVQDGKYICRVIYGDRLADIYTKLLIIYVFILGGFLLWPFDFIFKVKNHAHWIENSKGIELLRTGKAVSNSSTQEFFDRLVKGSGLTLEVWLETEDLDQSGPARIISYAINKELCNFILGQAWDKLIVRLRTTKTSFKGTAPHLVIPDTFTSHRLKHIVIMYDYSEQRIYINGEQRVRSNVLKGDFSNWDASCKLVIGNEVTGDRPWRGKIYYIAIFDRALTEQEIRQNYLSGFQSEINTCPSVLLGKASMKHTGLKTKNPVTKYLFNEGKGDMIHDSGSGLIPVNLFIPNYISHKKEPLFTLSIGFLKRNYRFSDLIINVLIFIPLGIFVHGMLRNHYGLTLEISLATLLAGTLFSLSIESLQHFSMTRNSSIIDVFTNMTGIAIGIMIDRFYILFLNYQDRHLWTQINTDYQDS
jgi:hypothetical protein